MQEVMSLEGKTIVVTGAAQGIGAAIANLAVALGARVIGIDLNSDKLNAFAAATNGQLLPYVGNVADPKFTEDTVRDVMARIGKAGRASPGSIVNISSDAGRAGSIGQINYAAAKSGLLGMTMSAAREWSKFGVRTNSVCFGVVETPMVVSYLTRDGVVQASLNFDENGKIKTCRCRPVDAKR